VREGRSETGRGRENAQPSPDDTTCGRAGGQQGLSNAWADSGGVGTEVAPVLAADPAGFGDFSGATNPFGAPTPKATAAPVNPFGTPAAAADGAHLASNGNAGGSVYEDPFAGLGHSPSQSNGGQKASEPCLGVGGEMQAAPMGLAGAALAAFDDVGAASNVGQQDVMPQRIGQQSMVPPAGQHNMMQPHMAPQQQGQQSQQSHGGNMMFPQNPQMGMLPQVGHPNFVQQQQQQGGMGHFNQNWGGGMPGMAPQSYGMAMGMPGMMGGLSMYSGVGVGGMGAGMGSAGATDTPQVPVKVQETVPDKPDLFAGFGDVSQFKKKADQKSVDNPFDF